MEIAREARVPTKDPEKAVQEIASRLEQLEKVKEGMKAAGLDDSQVKEFVENALKVLRLFSSGMTARSMAAWAIMAMKKRPKISHSSCFKRSFAVFIRIIFPLFMASNISTLLRGFENIRSKVEA